MPTSRPISTISYNSERFLRMTLEKMVDDDLIQMYRFIFHRGEKKPDADDNPQVPIINEDGEVVEYVDKYTSEEQKFDKDHFHVFLFPNKSLNLRKIRKDYFVEPVPGAQPLGCMPFYTSDEYNWLLYVIHDPDYLKAHNADSADGKIQYGEDKVISNEPLLTEFAFRRARIAEENYQLNIVKSLEKGISPVELVKDGKNPTQVLNLSRLLYMDKQKELLQKISYMEHINHAICQLLRTKTDYTIVYDSKYVDKHLPIKILDEQSNIILDFSRIEN